jgi:hypothetical protein
MSMPHATWDSLPLPSPSHMAALRLAASHLTGPTRRAFEAEMPLQYGGGKPLRAAAVCGWGRQTVALGVAERRPGLRCLGAQAACSGRTRWAERQPQGAEARRQRAEAQAPHAPTWRTRLPSTRLTATAGVEARRAPGSGAACVPAPRPRAAGRKRLGVRWRTVVKAKPHKKLQETDALCDQRKKSGPRQGIPRRQTLAYGWESARDKRRVVPWRAPARRPPSPRSR